MMNTMENMHTEGNENKRNDHQLDISMIGEQISFVST